MHRISRRRSYPTCSHTSISTLFFRNCSSGWFIFFLRVLIQFRTKFPQAGAQRLTRLPPNNTSAINKITNNSVVPIRPISYSSCNYIL